MNIMTLIQRHPLLRRDLLSLGIDRARLNHIAREIAKQLGNGEAAPSDAAGHPSANLCYVLHGMDRTRFVTSIDTSEVAIETAIAPSVAQAVILLIAPWVDRFTMQAV